MVQDPWLTADFIWNILGYTVVLLVISWILEHFKSDSHPTRRIVLSIGTAILGYFLFHLFSIPNIKFSKTIIYLLFIIVWIFIALLIYKAIKPDMQKVLKGFFSILVSFGMILSFFYLLIPIENLSVNWRIANSDDRVWVPVIIWVVSSALFYAAFNPKMNRFLRIILGMVCGLAVTAILQPPFLQLY